MRVSCGAARCRHGGMLPGCDVSGVRWKRSAGAACHPVSHPCAQPGGRREEGSGAGRAAKPPPSPQSHQAAAMERRGVPPLSPGAGEGHRKWAERGGEGTAVSTNKKREAARLIQWQSVEGGDARRRGNLDGAGNRRLREAAKVGRGLREGK